MYHLVDSSLETFLQCLTKDTALPFLEGLQDAMEYDSSDPVICVECGELVRLTDNSEFEANESMYRINVFFKADEIEKKDDEE